MLTILLFILGLQPLHEAGYRGEGKTIAVIDAGFYRANDENLFDQSHIIDSFDLLPDSLNRGNMFTGEDDAHGCQVLSTMLHESSEFTGTAPDANYILIRSENIKAEYKAETEHLIRGLHIADSLNADIITISLGYNTFNQDIGNYTYDSLNGQTRLAQAVTAMARRGRLVCVAAGNSGSSTWKKLLVPADADSALTVGAVDSLGNAASFSGWGPTADGRVKPEVCAWGKETKIYSPITNQLVRRDGTSYSTPEIAGMAACIWQAVPSLSAMELRDLIIRSASLYPNHDDQRGYGIPDAEKAIQIATALQDSKAQANRHSARKYLENGRLVIQIGNRKIDLTGQEIQ